ncbi:MAG: MarR family winged helix-turn-helix transcriptional regulator [Limosilactobacillus sp.]
MRKFRGQQIKVLNILSEKEVQKNVSKIVPDLTPQQTMVLMFLRGSEDHQLLQKQLENQLRISHATTRGVIKRLENLGVVSTQPALPDRRQVQVSLTPVGLRMMSTKFNQINDAIEKTEAVLTKGISAEDLVIFDKVVQQMIANFD